MASLDSEERYQQLAGKWLDGSISPEEEREFAEWYNSGQDASVHVSASHGTSPEEQSSRIYRQIHQRVSPSRFTVFGWSGGRWVAAAASVVLLLGVFYFFVLRKSEQPDLPRVASAADIAPGRDKAVLTLSDGSVLALDELENGVVKEENGIRIQKKDGVLEYELVNQGSTAPAFNTITTPRGGQFKVNLPDGSQVWLNSASTLRYPTAFSGSVREVALSGEAYFEIARETDKSGKRKPFIVDVVNQQKVEVLGTHFNVMAYSEEEAIKTTLLEGSVRVSRLGTTGGVRKLKPGQQSVQREEGGIEVQNDVDTEEIVAWKNGQIAFKDADIRSIMRQVSRWYDVEVEYQPGIEHRLFTGGISRNSNLSSLLKILELNDIHFRVKDRKIVVTP